MERRALRWQKLCPSQTPAWVTNFNATLTILSLQWPFKWQPLKIYTAEFCCSCFSISIISYSSCCSVQWLSSDPGVFPPPQPRPTSFSSLYSCKRLDCSSFAVWQMFLPLSSLYRKQTCEIFCIPELLVQMYLRVPLTWCRYLPESDRRVKLLLSITARPTSVPSGRGRLKCQGDVLLITFLSAWLCPDIKPNVLPVTLRQAMSLRIYHRTLRPGIIGAGGRGSPASLCDKLLSDRPQNAKNRIKPWSWTQLIAHDATTPNFIGWIAAVGLSFPECVSSPPPFLAAYFQAERGCSPVHANQSAHLIRIDAQSTHLLSVLKAWLSLPSLPTHWSTPCGSA